MWKSWQALFFISILIIVVTSSSLHPAISDSQTDNWNIHWVKGKYYLPNYKLAYQVFKIPYQITNASVEKIDVPDQSEGPFAGGTALVDIMTKGNGILKIQIPRNLPFSNSGDNKPSIFVDGQFPSGSTQESQTTCFMEFTIPFTANNKEIEFFGSQLPSDSAGPIRGADVPAECIIVPPPKQQLENGILPQNVTCSENQVLVKRIIDNSPACVKPQTAQKLLERGWTQPIANTSPEYSVLTNNSTENSSTGTMNVTYARLSVNYTVTNAKIFNFKYDPEDISINTRFQANDDGNLTILIPRALLDARINNLDYQFIVFDNGHEINFKEIKKTSMDRTLSIPFVQGDNQIEIIGANPN